MSLLNAPDPQAAPEGAAPGSGAQQARRYWRSLNAMAETPEFKAFVQREFPEHASEMLSPFSRRTFLNLMGASVAFAGLLTGCRKPEQHIVPFSKKVDHFTPGLPNFFATSFECAGQVVGTIAKSHDFRPVKLEGNPEFPTNLGALDAMTQALILQLYDPDRSTTALNAGKTIETKAALDAVAGLGASHVGRRGAGLRILSEPTASPSLLAQRAAFLAANPEARWHVWSPANADAAYAGTRLALGRPLRTVVDYSRADVVVALDGDFLAHGPKTLRAQKQFSRRRKPELGPMNRLYVVECMHTLTGAMADHRLRLDPGRIQEFAQTLGARLGLTLPGVEPPQGEAARWLAALARDVEAHRGRVAFVAGAHTTPALHAIAAALNVTFGADCVRFAEPVDALSADQAGSLRELAQALAQGTVETLVILGGNPAYDAPGELKFAEALKRAKTSVHLSLYQDETSRACTWHIPQAHVLESWGDVLAFDGTIGLTQPLIAPLYGGVTCTELLARLGEATPRSGYDLVREFHGTATPGAGFEAQWRQWLHDGLRPSTGARLIAPGALSVGNLASLPAPLAAPTDQAVVVQLLPDYKVHDGRFANNGWLQELADPISKLTWDNAAYVSQKTAQHFKLKTEDVIRLTTEAGEISAPVTVLPGVADFCVVLHLGYGRTAGGRIAEREVGVSAYPLLRASGVRELAGVKLAKTSRTYTLANVQDHWAMEERALVLEGTAEQYAREPEAIIAPALMHHGESHAVGNKGKAPGGHASGGHEVPPLGADAHDADGHEAHHAELSPFKEHRYDHGPQWGMSIDLSACTGCGACTVACFAENNIPIVGKEQVRHGREMAWIRIDRYFAATGKNETIPDSAEVVMQPMGCQHCEMAPCEQVCPVAATTHSPDGLNEMTYNRCIGTRYCSNNCPFKVRRFNFFNYQETDLQIGGKQVGVVRDGAASHVLRAEGGNVDLVSLARNPDVTVRSRGVMEKCTYCVQRIRRTTQEHKVAGRTLKDGEILTACQQTCPSEAIVFGDIRDAQSAVSQQKALDRNYGLLEFLYIKPRTSYLARLRNPNPELVA